MKLQPLLLLYAALPATGTPPTTTLTEPTTTTLISAKSSTSTAQAATNQDQDINASTTDPQPACTGHVQPLSCFSIYSDTVSASATSSHVEHSSSRGSSSTAATASGRSSSSAPSTLSTNTSTPAGTGTDTQNGGTLTSNVPMQMLTQLPRAWPYTRAAVARRPGVTARFTFTGEDGEAQGVVVESLVWNPRPLGGEVEFLGNYTQSVVLEGTGEVGLAPAPRLTSGGREAESLESSTSSPPSSLEISVSSESVSSSTSVSVSAAGNLTSSVTFTSSEPSSSPLP